MAEEKKPGLFSRLFGGGAKPAATPEPNRHEDEEPALPSFLQPAAKPVPATPVADEPTIVVEAAPAPVPPPAPEPVPFVVEKPTPAPDPAAVALQPSLAAQPPPAPPAVSPAPATEPKRSWFERLKSGLSRSSSALGSGIVAIFTKRKLDDDTLEELENILIQADLGVTTATAITERLAEGRYGKDISEDEVKSVLADEVEKVLLPVARPFTLDSDLKPHVVLVVGVNGSGKTTTIGKLAAKFRAEGRSVMMAAGDTFRAAAIDQLKIWGERTGTPVVARPVGSDAAGLAFDALTQAKEEERDVLLVDTAGRLQNKAELMAELEKVVRVLRKVDPSAPHSVLLVLDATTGQNALNQVEVFGRTAGVTGLVMTKLDGTARGGILVAISRKFGMPVHFVGVGEGVDDLEPFAARDFARAIAGLER